MNDEFLIKNTTKEQRIALIKQWIPDDDGLNDCDIDLWDMYAEYINGKKEISECNQAFSVKLEKERTMIFICYPKCTTCQKAKKWLDDNNINYEMRDIKTDKPSLKELTKWYAQSGLVLKKFFNTSGNIYKAMGLKDKLSDMSEEDQLKLLASDGMLVKRPILISGDNVLVGFKEDEWKELAESRK